MATTPPQPLPPSSDAPAHEDAAGVATEASLAVQQPVPLPDPARLPYLLPPHRTFTGRGDLLTTAPMLDWSNRHWRYFVRLLTKHTKVFTEMIVDSTLKYSKHAEYYLEYHPAEHPIACQLGGSDPALLAHAARMVAAAGYDEINLNVGCPSDRVAGRGAFGAALMFRPELVRDCVTAMHEAVGGAVPITVKCRLGADDLDTYEDFSRFLRIVASTGAVTHFIVHARKCLLKGLSPKDNRTIPPLKYHWVQRAAMEFPELRISLNGGVESLDAVEELLAARRGEDGDFSSVLAAHLAAVEAKAAAVAAAAAGKEVKEEATETADGAAPAEKAAVVATRPATPPPPSSASASPAPASVSLFAKLRRRVARLGCASKAAASTDGPQAAPAPAPAAASIEAAPSSSSPAAAAACGMCAEDAAEAAAAAAELQAAAAPAPAAGKAPRAPSSRQRFRPDRKAIAAAKQAVAAEVGADEAGAALPVSPLDPPPRPDAPLSLRCPLITLPSSSPSPSSFGTATSVLDSVMVGRAAYNNPWLLADADRRIFGVPNPGLSRREVVAAYLDYAEAFLAADSGAGAAAAAAVAEEEGGSAAAAAKPKGGLYGQFEIIKPLMALFHGKNGGSKFRTAVSTASQTERLPLRAAVMKALAQVPDEVLDERPPV